MFIRLNTLLGFITVESDVKMENSCHCVNGYHVDKQIVLSRKLITYVFS